MKERIHNALVTLLFTVVLMVMLANCVYYKSVPVQPTIQHKVTEACIICQWIAWFQWVKAGGTWSGGETRPTKPKSGAEDYKL